MKILIVSTHDMRGGAAKAAYRLHKSLLKSGVDSVFLVQTKSSSDHTVISRENKIQKAIHRLRYSLDRIPVDRYKKKTNTLFSVAWVPFSNTVNTINEINPDIVHFHWICGGMLRFEDLENINAKIVFSLHDMWLLTGGCHYDDNCGAYEYGCGKCKVLRSNKKNDLSKKGFNRKRKVLEKIPNITVVGLSQWIASCAKKSPYIKNENVINLPNPIDTEKYRAFDRQVCRDLWGLPKSGKKLILFGADNATIDPRKGFKELMSALEMLKASDIELVVIGGGGMKSPMDIGYKVHYPGKVSDDVGLVTLYSAVDLVVVPSLQENLSNMIMESMACETPVVAFDTGGNGDMIDHKKTGYLARSFDVDDLSKGIKWVINASNYRELCRSARDKVLKEFDSRVVASKYINLYSDIIA